MNILYFKEPTPHLILEDIFDEKQLKEIWLELDFLNSSLNLSSDIQQIDTEPARDINGNPLKQNTGRFLHHVYADINHSFIVRYTRSKALSPQVTNSWEVNWIRKMYSNTNWSCLLTSYYKNGDYYLPHTDNAVFTFLIWLWKEPKKFEGGNFYFSDINHKVECKNNSGIIFLSSEKHEVDKVITEHNDFGRYCITMFSWVNISN